MSAKIRTRLNPIEPVFAKLKHLLRSALPLRAPEECANCLKTQAIEAFAISFSFLAAGGDCHQSQLSRHR